MKLNCYIKIYLLSILVLATFNCVILNAQDCSRYSQYTYNHFVPNLVNLSVRDNLEINSGLFSFSESFIFSLSVINKIENKQGYHNTKYSTSRHFFIITGIIILLKSWLNLEPKILFRLIKSVPFLYKDNINLFTQENYKIDISYSINETKISNPYLQIKRYIKVGTPFYYGKFKLSSVARVSHESSIGYTMNYV